LYLILMSAGGYLIVRFGGSWGALAKIVFFVGAVVVLLTLLFSSRLQARLKVFLNKHFFHNKYDYRDEWLRLVSTLADFDKNTAPNVVIRAIAQIVDSPSGAMWVRGGDNPEFRLTARFGTEDEFPDIPQDAELIRFIEKEGWLIDFVEYASHPERYGNLSFPAWLHERDTAWLIVPLQSAGELLGVILLSKGAGPLRLNYEDRDLLKTVGNHIAVHLSQARSDGMLAEARQFEAFNRLTAFLLHDLNNLIAQQSLVVSNAERFRDNPKFVDDAIDTIANSVSRMKRLMEQLTKGFKTPQKRSTNLQEVLSSAVQRSSELRPEPTLLDFDGSIQVMADSDRLTTAFEHLIRNAQDATADSDRIDITVSVTNGLVLVSISDTGEGMNAEFIRERLFRPFDSTKGSHAMGIGAYQVREYARMLGGRLEVRSSAGQGTTFVLQLPTAT
jgi:putative PEP-CTERM system histidine kinase